jgi:hypothetical protein
MVIFDGRPAQTNLIVKLPGRQHIFPRESILTENPAAFAHANLNSKRHQFSIGIPGNARAKES